jgi:hypothetical protein
MLNIGIKNHTTLNEQMSDNKPEPRTHFREFNAAHLYKGMHVHGSHNLKNLANTF